MRTDSSMWAGRLLGAVLLAVSAAAAAQMRIDIGPPFVALTPAAPPGLVELDPPLADRFPEQADMQSAFDARDYERAQALAQGIVDAARDDFGSDDPRIAQPLTNLATVQQHAGEYGAAITTYKQAVAALRATGNARDPRLERPLRGLGIALYAAGRYEEAADALQRAAFITRVNQGLKSLDQLRVYPLLTQCYIAMGKYDEAVERQQARLAIVEAATGSGSPELEAAMSDAAGWLRRMGRYFDERRLDERRMDMLREQYGYDDPRLVPALRDLAGTYRSTYQPDLLGLQYIEHAVDIERDAPDISPAERARTLIALGDFYLTFHDAGRAAQYYGQAHDLLADAGKQSAIAAMLEQPQPVFFPDPPPASGTPNPPPAAWPAAEYQLQFTVDVHGRISDVEVLSIKPEQARKRRARVLHALRDARFRPRVTEQGPVATKGVRYDYRFRYLPEN